MTKYHKESYGSWAGNSRGQKPDLTRCAASVFPGKSYISSQCSRKCGHGPGGAFCKAHGKKQEARESKKC